MKTEEKTIQKDEMDMSINNDDSFEMTSKSEVKPQCAISGLIKNHIIVLEEALGTAKIKYADASLDDENWSGRYERKMECKVLEGQISILSKLINDFECMFTSQNEIPA